MTKTFYGVLAIISVVGAVFLAALNRDATTITALIGLAGTLAGRGK